MRAPLIVAAASMLLSAAAPEPRPRNVIVMIPDGCGPASVTLARLVRGRPLTLDSLLVGAVDTRSSSSRVTDSGAAATAYASGVRTRNRALGVDEAARPVATLMELARARGMATGAVVLSAVTDATPAAFFAHAGNRWEQDDIAVQELAHHPDVLMGGGLDHFAGPAGGGRRPDSLDLVARARAQGYAVVTRETDLARPLRLPVLGLFARGNMRHAIDRAGTGEPMLPAMTGRALEALGRARRPFVLVVEGSLIDLAAHDNDPATHVRDVLEYDRTVAEAVTFARRDGHTLVVSMSDHECGGLALGRRLADTSVTDIDPAVLAAVRASAVRMADSLAAGVPLPHVMETLAGLGALRPDEQARLDAARGDDKRVRQAIAEIESARAHLDWTTGWHTAVDVGLYAFGPGSTRLHGVMRNDVLGQVIAGLLGLALPQPAHAAPPPARDARH